MTKTTPKIDPDAPPARVAAMWRTVSDFARAVERPRSTVQKWLERGYFPPEEHANIVRAARQSLKRNLRPADLVDARDFARPTNDATSAAA